MKTGMRDAMATGANDYVRLVNIAVHLLVPYEMRDDEHVYPTTAVVSLIYFMTYFLPESFTGFFCP